jgi:hypothetical protein
LGDLEWWAVESRELPVKEGSSYSSPPFEPLVDVKVNVKANVPPCLSARDESWEDVANPVDAPHVMSIVHRIGSIRLAIVSAVGMLSGQLCDIPAPV